MSLATVAAENISCWLWAQSLSFQAGPPLKWRGQAGPWPAAARPRLSHHKPLIVY